MTQGAPAKTTLTPAFLSYRTAFSDFNYGSGAAISFILFLIIVLMTLIQRWVMRDRDKPPGGRRGRFGRRRGAPIDPAGPTSPSSPIGSSGRFGPWEGGENVRIKPDADRSGVGA
jgi:hypothetical protein